jgi:hypothetical protein
MDDIVDAYKSGVDRTLIRWMLTLTPDQRVREMAAAAAFADEPRRAAAPER